VTFLDSTGLGALVQAYRLAEAGRVDVGVTDPRPDVRATFDVTGLTPLLLHPGA
jgi:anti-anti-sigma factor